MISLTEDKEKILRNLAHTVYGGRKGSLSTVIEDALEEMARRDKKLRAAKHQIALMKKGFNLGLRDKKAYEKRSDIYD